jgi:adenosylhomocysteinase
VFSVAESELKATVEAPGVASAAVRALRAILPNEKFEGRRVAVVGFGRIGAALSDILKKSNCVVEVCDTSAAQAVTARERGYVVSRELTPLIANFKPHVIFACAEPKCVPQEALAAIDRDTILVSLTSRDAAVDKLALEGMATSTREILNVGIEYLVDGHRILLIANGFPVNFWLAESMPNQHSDLVMASLLYGALRLALDENRWKPGNEWAIANAALNESGLLEEYFRLHT